MSTKKHAGAPDLCPECLELLLQEIARMTKPVAAAVAHCPHFQTLAMATAAQGRIVRWLLQSPIDRAEFLAQRDELMQAAGFDAASDSRH